MDVMERSVTQAELIDLEQRLAKFGGSSGFDDSAPVGAVRIALRSLIGWFAVQ